MVAFLLAELDSVRFRTIQSQQRSVHSFATILLTKPQELRSLGTVVLAKKLQYPFRRECYFETNQCLGPPIIGIPDTLRSRFEDTWAFGISPAG